MDKLEHLDIVGINGLEFIDVIVTNGLGHARKASLRSLSIYFGWTASLRFGPPNPNEVPPTTFQGFTSLQKLQLDGLSPAAMNVVLTALASGDLPCLSTFAFYPCKIDVPLMRKLVDGILHGNLQHVKELHVDAKYCYDDGAISVLIELMPRLDCLKVGGSWIDSAGKEQLRAEAENHPGLTFEIIEGTHNE